MHDFDRVRAGISCRDVLTHLSDFLDGDLDTERLSLIRAHLGECSVCEQFGGEMGSLVGALRRQMSEPDALEAGMADRLRARLRQARDGTP